MIFNQMTETHCVRDLAKMISDLTGVKTKSLHNPRNEAAENGLEVENAKFLALGLKPTTLDEGLLAEVMDIASKYSHRCNQDKIKPSSLWISPPVTSEVTGLKKDLKMQHAAAAEEEMTIPSVSSIPEISSRGFGDR